MHRQITSKGVFIFDDIIIKEEDISMDDVNYQEDNVTHKEEDYINVTAKKVFILDEFTIEDDSSFNDTIIQEEDHITFKKDVDIMQHAITAKEDSIFEDIIIKEAVSLDDTTGQEDHVTAKKDYDITVKEDDCITVKKESHISAKEEVIKFDNIIIKEEDLSLDYITVQEDHVTVKKEHCVTPKEGVIMFDDIDMKEKDISLNNITVQDENYITAEKDNDIIVNEKCHIAVEKESYITVKEEGLDVDIPIDIELSLQPTNQKINPIRAEQTCYQYFCNICSTGFNDQECLDTHNQIHAEEKCELCIEGFSTVRQLKNHLINHAEGNTYSIEFGSLRTHSTNLFFESNKCYRCHKYFHNKGTFVSHLQFHWDKRHLVCDICGTSFYDYLELNAHFRCHLDAQNTKQECDQYVCDICNIVFNDQECLDTHIQIHAEEKGELCIGGSRTNICNICDVAFVSSEFLKKHIHQSHAKRKCKSESLPKKRKSVRGTGKVRVREGRITRICEFCNKVLLKTTWGFQRHLYLHKKEKNLFVRHASRQQITTDILRNCLEKKN